MSVLTRPYEITVWEDVLIHGFLTEQKLGVIGSDKMDAQCRALDPTLTRNVNGTKKLTFNMYKHYVDNMTGEKVENPFCDWLISERKVKLEYDGKWYDFIIKDISENSSNYLYTYSLEDALVQELSKNGFGITLDAQLMNNVGDAQELGEYVLTETDWDVESEVFVQAVDESLVYIQIPRGTKAKHVLDQRKDKLNQGVADEDFVFPEDKDVTVLAFYSSCKNKPHRFQFIYTNDGDYDKSEDGRYKISRKDDRTIEESDCQYYIDFDDPDSVYITDYTGSSQCANIKLLNLSLPSGFVDGVPGRRMEPGNPDPLEEDSALSSWYRGKRYGFAQQSEYVPLLERYCSKFRRNERIPIIWNTTTFVGAATGEGSEGIANGIIVSKTLKSDSQEVSTITIEKDLPWTGIGLKLAHHDVDQYVIRYRLTKISGTLETIGGHNSAYKPIKYFITDSNGNTIISSTENVSYVGVTDLGENEYYDVEIVYVKRDTTDTNKNLYIQPNRSRNTMVKCVISNLSLTMVGDYYGYTESEFQSPTLIQNCITNYNFESSGGWYATDSAEYSSTTKPETKNVFGRINNNSFVSIVDDFYSGDYSEELDYYPYMRLTFKRGTQFVLNSGIKDNSTMIQNMNVGEEWILDTKIIKPSSGSAVNLSGDFNFSIGEYRYNVVTGTYIEENDAISIQAVGNAITTNDGYFRTTFRVQSSIYTKETFKKQSAIYLKIAPKALGSGENAGVYYIEKIALYRKVLDDNGNIIVPDYESENSKSAQEFVDSGTIEHKYHYFSTWLLDNNNPERVTEKDSLPTLVKTTLNYIDYLPVYNEGAKKVRSLTAKESNYFNILQSIAETFECWVDLVVERKDQSAPGRITGKKVQFKNYVGQDNYANFRYGVNLKDIQRTYSSKNITTKLIVKQNNNEHAENGFCTIQRAGSNPTGENYIYDFQYYQNQGIMDTEDFLQTAYYLNGAVGPDGAIWNNSDCVLPNGLLYFDAEKKSITTNATNTNLTKVPVYPGQKIKVTSKIKAGQSCKKLVLLHQFFQTLNGDRYTYTWANSESPDVTPPSNSSAYFEIGTNYKEFTSIIEVPNGCKFYSLGLRSTNGESIDPKDTQTFFTDIKIEVIEGSQTNLNGYYPRIKKLNEAIIPINEELVGLQADLTQKKAKLEVAEAIHEAAISGIEQTREDFFALTGLFPEEIQTDDIISISNTTATGKETVESQQDWWHVKQNGISFNGSNKSVSVILELSEYERGCSINYEESQGTQITKLNSGFQMAKSEKWEGIYIKEQWEEGRVYTLEYDVEVVSGDSNSNLTALGGHPGFFNNYTYTINGEDFKNNSVCNLTNIEPEQGIYHVKFTGTYSANGRNVTYNGQNAIWIQPNRGSDEPSGKQIVCEISNLKLSKTITKEEAVKTSDRTANYYLNVDVKVDDGSAAGKIIHRTYSVSCTVPGTSEDAENPITEVTSTTTISQIDFDRSDVQKYITEYTTFYEKRENSLAEKNIYQPEVTALEDSIKILTDKRNTLLEYKTLLNQMFFKKYSRFILEGTWMSEEYVDDDKYYADAQSVMYNSCYPQVAYSINVLSLKGLSEYKLINFGLGDKTNVIDPQFFGSNYREEVVITEISEALDDPSKDTIKVQNFKNQFQDLFQRITATVQQAQYNAGSYEKGAKLVESDIETRGEFVANAITNASQYLEFGQTVDFGKDGITITDNSNKQNSLKLVGGAILFSVEKPDTKDNTWMTGITKDGISANLITAGQLDTGMIQIMSGNVPVFKWDTYGISAYSATWTGEGYNKAISNVDSTKFVRFDQFGIYGIDKILDGNGKIVDGKSWTPSNNAEIDEKATFSLTWEGLKVSQPLTNGKQATARIGNYQWNAGTEANPEWKTSIIKINNGQKDTFLVDGNGNTTLSGKISMISEQKKIIMDTENDEDIISVNVSGQDVFSISSYGNLSIVGTMSMPRPDGYHGMAPSIDTDNTTLVGNTYIYDSDSNGYIDSYASIMFGNITQYQGSLGEAYQRFRSMPLRISYNNILAEGVAYWTDLFCISNVDHGLKGRSLTLVDESEIQNWVGKIKEGSHGAVTDDDIFSKVKIIPKPWEEIFGDSYDKKTKQWTKHTNSTIITNNGIILFGEYNQDQTLEERFATVISVKGITLIFPDGGMNSWNTWPDIL